VPSTVLPKLYKLADNNYKNLHEYFVDATPTVADAAVGGTWKTMLVAGLNGGGRGFYALDVTDPAAPKGMWEFKWSNTCYDSANPSTAGADCHIGLSFGKPLITKLADGRWVVMVTSGYNNVNAVPKTGDGLGYLYVLNAGTGEIIYKIATTAGNAVTPSGLAQINNYVEKAEIDNTTVRVYGTDLLGNIWRFDVNDNTAPSGREATLLGTAKDGSGVPQPITVRAELTRIGEQPMVFVATGKLLGATDVADLQTQSIYGIVDPVIGTTAFPNLRTALAPLAMTQTGSGIGATRTIACTGTSTQCSSADGWRVDLPDSGETGQRRDEAACGHARHRQQRAADQRLLGRRLQLAQLPQLAFGPGGHRFARARRVGADLQFADRRPHGRDHRRRERRPEGDRHHFGRRHRDAGDPEVRRSGQREADQLARSPVAVITDARPRRRPRSVT
jgi:type IV pilus assembly protein PilY1